MKSKVIGTAVAAALLALSTGAFAQAGGGSAAGSAAVGSNTPGDQKGSVTDRESGTPSVQQPGDRATPRDSATSRSTTHCDALSGAEKTRCMRDARASSGSSGLPSDSPTSNKPKSMGEGGGANK
jgi:hypothetical protein